MLPDDRVDARAELQRTYPSQAERFVIDNKRQIRHVTSVARVTWRPRPTMGRWYR